MGKKRKKNPKRRRPALPALPALPDDEDLTFSPGSSTSPSVPNEDQPPVDQSSPPQIETDTSSTSKPETTEIIEVSESNQFPETSSPIRIIVDHPIGKTTPTTKEVFFHVRDDIIKLKFTAHP